MKYTEIPANISGIYKILFPNGKIYVGRAINIKRRIWEHFVKIDNTPCQKALHKYYSNYKDIEVEILEKVNDLNNIYNIEIEWIKKLQSTDKEKGYNITSGGEGGGIGIYNSASKFSPRDLENIIQLLQENKTNVFISSLYNVHPDTIGKINQGKTYYNASLTYPIRKLKNQSEYKEKYNSLSNQQLEDILFLLQNSSLTNIQIGKKVGCSAATVGNINTGKHPYCNKVLINFPIRKNRKNVMLSEEDILEIKKQLLNPNLSIQDIADNFNCSRDTISDINNGKKYSQIDEYYPIRRFYPKRGSKKPVSTILGSEEQDCY